MSEDKKILKAEGQSKFSLRRKTDFILSEESAMEQVMSLLEYYDIDVDALPQVHGVNPIENSLKLLTGYIRQGRVEIRRNDKNELEVHFTLSGGSQAIVFSELSAKHKLAMDRGSDKGNYNKIYSLMASMAGLPLDAINKLQARDLSVIEILGMVFLAV